MYTVAIVTDAEDNVFKFYTAGKVQRVKMTYYVLGRLAEAQMTENNLLPSEVELNDVRDFHTVKVTYQVEKPEHGLWV